MVTRLKCPPKEPQGSAIITFPCDYPIKVVGDAHADYEEAVLAIARRHDPTLTLGRVSSRDSSAGKYRAVTLMIKAESEAQIKALFNELKQLESVRLVI